MVLHSIFSYAVLEGGLILVKLTIDDIEVIELRLVGNKEIFIVISLWSLKGGDGHRLGTFTLTLLILFSSSSACTCSVQLK
jgi:hypothetical protein